MYPLIIVIIVLIVILFIYLNNKISRLEKEISDLNKKILGKNTIQEIHEKLPMKATQQFSQESSTVKKSQIAYNNTNDTQKDWLTPAFSFLQQNALTIIGIFTLVLGIGYFVKYAIDKNWIGEPLRVGIGFITGVVIITTGHFLRKNYSSFASVITGGGIAVLYFTITIAFREYHLFSQNIAFSLTCLITLIAIFLSYYYNNKILIIFSLFGGFLAPFMISTGQSNYLFLFTYLSVLNIGMLALFFLKNWKSVGWIAFIFTHIYLFYWTIEKTDILNIYFYIINYIIFYSFALKNYFKTGTLLSSDILMLVLSNLLGIVGSVYIFSTLGYEPVVIFPIGFATVNALLFYKEYSKTHFGINYSVFAGITISLITIAFALQFKTHLITSVWAVEATLILFIWKKTSHKIFKICFYLLLPLVIIAQLITWAQYTELKNLSIVFNPIFLTSSVTAVTIFINLMLLRKLPDNQKSNSFFENIFSVISYGIIYLAVLLEIIYHISEQPWIVIFSIAVLFTLYYISGIILFRKKLDINPILEVAIIYVFLGLVIIDVLVSGSGIISNFLKKEIRLTFYYLYLLYLIPFLYLTVRMLSKTEFFKRKISYWYLAFAVVVFVSGEVYHCYILLNTDIISEIPILRKHFSLLYLPIIWTILASLLIYKGIKNNLAEYNKIGFVLIGVMIIKLYAYDVWEMDNISRITAFIILGIILLISSFLFQRLKKIIQTMVENKDEKENL
ncbi:Predicted membrane protein [Chryseobacterium arachidis]|uniref:Predicted membrane protein n=1 Tax=Chryseobacterium arachidis TaxID=1416778 RepID=A0A1M4UN83_9FLAO|nr:DUF2339 domain-containing protein [Chryseobacterium arachidis]SHE58040.1 Predicted membrane protein [Chryseobacterium arachidis]